MKIEHSTGARRYWLTALGLVGAFVSMSSNALTAAEEPRATITVRVYQATGLPSAFGKGALAEAEVVLRAARVDVQWRMCTGETGEHSATCDATPEPSELLLRMIRTRPARQDTAAVLGDAVVDPCAGGGVLATVYVNRVVSLAKATRTDGAALLGRVTAHELGHLLMGTNSHRRSGLMRPSWTRDEVRRNRPTDWMFTTTDVAAMAARAEIVRSAGLNERPGGGAPLGIDARDAEGSLPQSRR
jgi:hypothetical protein